MTPGKVHDGCVNVSTSEALCLRADDRSVDDDGNVGSVAANINDCCGRFIVHRNAGANGSSQPFLNHVNASNVCFLSRGEQGTLLYLSNSGQDAHNGPTA